MLVERVTQLLTRDGQVCNDRIPSEILQTVLLYAPVVEAVDMRKQEVILSAQVFRHL